MKSINLNTILSNILSICSSVNVKDQVSHPHKTSIKMIVLSRIIRMVFRGPTRRQTIMDRKTAETPWVYSTMISATKRHHWKMAAVPCSISRPNAFPPKFGMKKNKNVSPSRPISCDGPSRSQQPDHKVRTTAVWYACNWITRNSNCMTNRFISYIQHTQRQFIRSFIPYSYDRYTASSKSTSPRSAI